MPTEIVGICFILCMLALIALGFYCSHHLDHSHPFWVRLIVLAPCMTAFATLAAMALGAYVAFWPDVARAVSVMLIYALVASRFSGTPWLDIKTQKGQ
jgi:hypothetical protein